MNPVVQWWREHVNNPQIVYLVILLGLGWLAMTFVTDVFAPVFTAVVLSYLLDAPTTALHQRGMRRTWAALAVWVAFMTFAVMAIAYLGPLLIKQSVQVLQDLPRLVEAFRNWVAAVGARQPELMPPEQIDQLAGTLTFDALSLKNQILKRSHLLGAGVNFAVIYGILVPILILLFLKDKQRIQHWARAFMPQDIGLISKVWHDMDGQIAGYVRGKLIEIGIVWGITYAVFSIIGLNYALLLGMITGLSVLIPFVGAALVTLPVALVAFAQYGAGAQLAGVMIAYGVIQALDGNVLVPLLFAEISGLHPSAIIVAVLFFGTIWGFWGVFFAIPLATLVHAVIKAWPKNPVVAEQ
ncbi:MAG: AI-2E family transporter [Panacagrimonas sp.]